MAKKKNKPKGQRTLEETFVWVERAEGRQAGTSGRGKPS